MYFVFENYQKKILTGDISAFYQIIGKIIAMRHLEIIWDLKELSLSLYPYQKYQGNNHKIIGIEKLPINNPYPHYGSFGHFLDLFYEKCIHVGRKAQKSGQWQIGDYLF